MSKEVHEKAIQELKRLELMPPMSRRIRRSARNYLDWLLAVAPGRSASKEIREQSKPAEKILNDEHYGAGKKSKSAFLEFLAVRQAS